MDDQFHDMDPAALRPVCAMMGCLTDELSVTSADGGWAMEAMDTSHTAMCSATVAAPPLSEDRWTVRLADLERCLSAGDLSLRLTDGFLEARYGRMGSRVRLLSDPDPFKRPMLEHDATAAFLASDLRAFCSQVDVKRVDRTRIVIDDDGVTMVAHDEQGAGQSLAVPPEECVDLSGRAAVILNSDMLARFARTLPKDATVTMGASDDYPVTIAVSEPGRWSVEWMCAPMIVDGE